MANQTVKKARQPKAAVAKPSWQTQARRLVKWVGLPLLIYFIFFCIFTWPWITHFRGWYFTDNGDGLQNVWNMWWINKSVVQLHQLPWHTGLLHYPWGVTLLGQTMNPFNGFVGIILMHVFGLSLVHTFNIMIIFSFVVGGLTAFWLCYYFSRSYVASLVGGFIFTFSSYHFAHAIGHMQLVSLEWIPLFILLWWTLLKRPHLWIAIAASVSLFLALFCDYYYFLYSVIIAAFIFIYLYWRKEIPSLKDKNTYVPLLVFLGLSLLIITPLPLALLRLNAREVLDGAHNARIFSTDLFAPFVDGGFWRFHSWTFGYWRQVKAFVSESSIYLTISLLVVFVISWFQRKKLQRDYYFLVFLAIFFGIMSFGPRLHLGRHTLESVPMPYVLLEKIVPGLKLSGVPVRMMLITILALAVIATLVLARLNLRTWKGKLLIAAFVIVYAIEVWPATLPLTPRSYAPYVYALHNVAKGAVLDDAANSSAEQLLDQTEHEQPMILGYISRTPKSLKDKEATMVAAISRGYYTILCKDYKLRYITTPAFRPLHTTFPAIYHDKQAIIYDLKNSPNC